MFGQIQILLARLRVPPRARVMERLDESDARGNNRGCVSVNAKTAHFGAPAQSLGWFDRLGTRIQRRNDLESG
jgi:hypothetical protein